jgi:hypothetical protein
LRPTPAQTPQAAAANPNLFIVAKKSSAATAAVFTAQRSTNFIPTAANDSIPAFP